MLKGEQKVSHIAQHEHGARWAASHDAEVVDTFQDLDVSADKFDPWQRPDLGQWLDEERAFEWDAIVFSKIDRAFRSTWDCVKFARWIKDHQKILVFAEDGLTLNYRDKNTSEIETMMAELFIYIGSFFAQIELNRFRTRALDGHRVLRQTDRWASGSPALGFTSIPHPSGKGRGLATDPEGKELLHEMARLLFDGWSFTRIAAWLNETRVPTYSARNGYKVKSKTKNRWNVNNVIDAFTSLKTQGVKMHQGQPVLTPNGEMIQLAPPTFDDATWTRIQAEVAKRRLSGKRRTHSPNLMLGVGKCGSCGATLTQITSKVKDRTYRYYRCGHTPVNCRGVSMKVEDANQILEESFLEQRGSHFVKVRKFVAGEDNSAELERVKNTIDRLRRESDAGLIDGEEDEQLYFERMTALVARRKALEAQPVRKPGWTTEKTDQTYSEAWKDADTEARRKLLVDAGVSFVLHSKLQAQVHVDLTSLEKNFPA